MSCMMPNAADVCVRACCVLLVLMGHSNTTALLCMDNL